MPLFRKKPVTIEAVQFDGTPESGAAIVSWAQSFGVEEVEFHPFLADHFKGDPKVYVARPDPYMRIKTLEGVMTASRDDWIIRGVKGEFYPCKPDIFEETYEPVAAAQGDEREKVTVGFVGGPWDDQTVKTDRVVGPLFAVGHEIGNHYWLDTKSDPPTYHWDGTPFEFSAGAKVDDAE